MRTSTRYSIICRISGALAGLWLCGAGTAWAGGGADFGTLTAVLTNSSGTGICDLFTIVPCPTVPSITQATLEAAALGNNLPEMLLRQNQFTPTTRVMANNPPAVPAVDYGISGGIPFPLDNSNPSLPLFIAATPGTNSLTNKNSNAGTPAFGLLSNLTPLAFISPPQPTSQSKATPAPSQTAPVTLPSDPNANSFLYAVGLSSRGVLGTGSPLPTPDYVYFFYDDLSRFNVSFTMGTTIAKFTFPLRVLTGSTERAVPTILSFVASSSSGGDCSMSNVVGDFNGTGDPTAPPTVSGTQPPGTQPPLTAAQVGINCAVVLSASPASTQPHAIFEVKVPLLVTQATDRLYFYGAEPTNNVLSSAINSPLTGQGVFTAFQNDTEFKPATGSTYLGTGTAIGLAPSAAPLCSDLFGSTGCPTTPIQPTFPLCASLPAKTTNNSVQLQPAVGAYFAMATSGETLLATALGAASNSTCSLQ